MFPSSVVKVLMGPCVIVVVRKRSNQLQAKVKHKRKKRLFIKREKEHIHFKNIIYVSTTQLAPANGGKNGFNVLCNCPLGNSSSI